MPLDTLGLEREVQITADAFVDGPQPLLFFLRGPASIGRVVPGLRLAGVEGSPIKE
jgi:hypothetical protein